MLFAFGGWNEVGAFLDFASGHGRFTRHLIQELPAERVFGEIEKLLHVEDRLRQRVVGQDDAVIAVSNAVRRSRSGLQDPNRPIGSFMFLGPTGVGKTETVKALADFLFQNREALTRLENMVTMGVASLPPKAIRSMHEPSPGSVRPAAAQRSKKT